MYERETEGQRQKQRRRLMLLRSTQGSLYLTIQR